MFGKRSNAIVVTGLLVASTTLHAGMRTLSWDPAPSATEYHLYYGSSSRVYTEVVDVGPATQTTINLDDCARWYFAVTASNPVGESGYSTEVDWLTPMSVDDVLFSGSGPIRQGFTGPVTVTGAGFKEDVVLKLEHPGWECPDGASDPQCDEYFLSRRSAVSLDLDYLDCNTVTAWATFASMTPGAAPTVGEYTLTATNTQPDDSSSASLTGAVEILLDPARRDTDKSEYWTDDRIDGLDLAGIMQVLPPDEPCTCCSDATCPTFRHEMDIDGDGWIDGNDLALVYTDHFGLCWDTGLSNWSAQACRSHLSETNPAR